MEKYGIIFRLSIKDNDDVLLTEYGFKNYDDANEFGKKVKMNVINYKSEHTKFNISYFIFLYKNNSDDDSTFENIDDVLGLNLLSDSEFSVFINDNIYIDENKLYERSYNLSLKEIGITDIEFINKLILHPQVKNRILNLKDENGKDINSSLLISRVQRILMGLPEKYVKVLYLVIGQGYSIREVSKKLELYPTYLIKGILFDGIETIVKMINNTIVWKK